MSDVVEAYNPHGAALLAYHRGNRDAVLICHQDGSRDDVPAAFWFRDEFDPLERLGLALSRGRVLDLGAGTGLHTLELQRRGLDVTAIDVAPECITIMRERGVRNAYTADLYAFEGGPFDTILSLCNGLDKVGTVDDLPRFLARMGSLLAPGGQLIADSFDVRIGATAQQAEVIERRISAGRYFGEMDLVFQFNERRGAPFTVLQIDYASLTAAASKGGWSIEKLSERGGHYLARLALSR